MDVFKGLKGTLLVTALLSSSAFAQDLSIKLEVLEKIHAQEQSGDELYFSVTEFAANSAPRHYRIPSFPSHWMSDYLKNVKDIVLWHKSYTTCEKTEVLISLVEADLPPWNVDDLLGAVELKVTCDQGKMHTEWSIPNKDNTAKMPNMQNAFAFTGDHSEYHGIFKLDTAKITVKIPDLDENTIPAKPKLKEPATNKEPILNKSGL